MINKSVPFRGGSDQSNVEYQECYTPKKLLSNLVGDCESPVIIDVGGHRGKSILFFKDVFPESFVYSIKSDPESFSLLSEVAFKKDVMFIKLL